MSRQLDTLRHLKVSLGLLLVMTTGIAPAATDDIALVALMSADGIWIALVVVFAEVQVGKRLPSSPRP